MADHVDDDYGVADDWAGGCFFGLVSLFCFGVVWFGLGWFVGCLVAFLRAVLCQERWVVFLLRWVTRLFVLTLGWTVQWGGVF